MKWYRSSEVLTCIRSLKSSGYNWQQVLNEIKNRFPHYTFCHVDTLRKKYKKQQNTVAISHNIVGINYVECYKDLCEYIGKPEELNKKNNTKKNKNKKTEKTTKTQTSKILVISDLHIPFHNRELLKKTVADNLDADLVIVAGDFTDCYSVSRFSKKFDIPLKEELTQAIAVMDWLSKTFPKVIVLEGNHTERIRKYFESRVGPELMFLVECDFLNLISTGLDNVEIVNDYYEFANGNGSAEIGYFTLIGKDFVVGHFEKNSVIPMRGAHSAYMWLESWSHVFNIPKIRLFLQGHTHRLSKYPLNYGEPVIGETGALCKVQNYSIEPKARYSSHINGYWVVYQENGITDLNKSNFIIC